MVKSNNNSAAFLLLLLFLVLATAPPALVFAYHYGVLPLPQLDYGSVMIFATAALFLLPVFFVLFAAVAMLLKKRKESGGVVGVAAKRAPKSEHYPWEGVFRTAEKEEFKAAKAKVRAAFVAPSAPKLNVAALVVVAVIVAATVIFFVIIVPGAKNVFTNIGQGSNLTNLTKLSTAEDASNASNAVKNESTNTLLQFFKTKLSGLKKGSITNLTEAAQLAEAAKAKQKQEKEAKQKEQRTSSFSALATKFKAAAAAVSKTVSKASKVKVFWPYALIGVGVLVLLAGGFYFYKAKKAKPTVEWLRACVADSAGWLVVLFAEVKRNSLKLLVSAVVIAVAALAFVFRSWLKVKLPAFSKVAVPVLAAIRESAISFFYATRNFLLAYRLYILIGIAVLLVVLCVLFLLERKGKEKEKGRGLEPAAPTAPKKSGKSGQNKRGSKHSSSPRR